MAALPSYDPETGAPLRLDSWKEIAGYFGKDVRTVRRWEVERGLPVHRVRGGERGSVFAYVTELEGWLRQSAAVAAAPKTEAVVSASPEAPAAAIVAVEPTPVPELKAVRENAEPLRMAGPPAARRTSLSSLLVLVALAGLLGLTAFLFAERRAAGASSARGQERQADAATRDLYLRGRYQWSLRTEASLTRAVDLFTQAIVRDPNYAQAYAGLADSYLLLREYGSMSDAEAYPRAYAASRRALSLDDQAVEAHRTYAFVLDHWMWKFGAAEAEYRRAIALDPRDGLSHHWYATSLLSAGRPRDALREIDEARRLQPDSTAVALDRGLILGSVDLPAGISALREMEQTNLEGASVHTYLATLLFEAGDLPGYLKEARQSAVLRGQAADVAVLDGAAKKLATNGERGMLVSLAEGYGALAEAPHSTRALQASLYYASLQEPEPTLHFLQLSLERRESDLQPVRFEREYKFLDENPQFQALLQRVQTPPAEELAARGD